MRMDPGGGAFSAAEVLNGLSADELARIFWEYGDERYSRRIANGIIQRRARGLRLETTGDLKNKEISLKELGEKANPPLSKSAIRHRFSKIEKLAKELGYKD